MTDINSMILSLAKRMPHCAEVHAVVAAIRSAKPTSGYQRLAEQAVSLSDNTKVPAILRLQLVKEMTEGLVRLAPPNVKPYLESLLFDLNTTDTSIHWLCVTHPQYGMASQTAESSMRTARITLLRLQADKHWAALDVEFSLRTPLWKAAASFEGSGIEVKEPKPSKEFWVVRMVDGKPRILIAADSGSLEKGWIIKPEPGEPIFMPSNGQSTRDAFTRIRSAGTKLSTEELTSDPAWPANYKD
jgi:hypothetical protein